MWDENRKTRSSNRLKEGIVFFVSDGIAAFLSAFLVYLLPLLFFPYWRGSDELRPVVLPIMAISTLLWPILFNLIDSLIFGVVRWKQAILFISCNVCLLISIGFPIQYFYFACPWIGLSLLYLFIVRNLMWKWVDIFAGPAVMILTFSVLLLSAEVVLDTLAYMHSVSGKEKVKTRDNSFTILCVGDSHTYGIGAPSGCSYPEQLQERAYRQCEQPINVINAGVPGSNSGQIYSVLEKSLPELHPALVLILFGQNDLWSSRDIPLEWKSGNNSKRSYLDWLWRDLQKSRVIRTLNILTYNLKHNNEQSEVRFATASPDFSFLEKEQQWDWTEGGEIDGITQLEMLRTYLHIVFPEDDFSAVIIWADHFGSGRSDRLKNAWAHLAIFIRTKNESVLEYSRDEFISYLKDFKDSGWAALGLVTCLNYFKAYDVMMQLQSKLTSIPIPQLMEQFSESPRRIGADVFLKLHFEGLLANRQSHELRNLLTTERNETVPLARDTIETYLFLDENYSLPFQDYKEKFKKRLSLAESSWSAARLITFLLDKNDLPEAFGIFDEWLTEHIESVTPEMLCLWLRHSVRNCGDAELIKTRASQLASVSPDNGLVAFGHAESDMHRYRQSGEKKYAEQALSAYIVAALKHVDFNLCYSRITSYLEKDDGNKFLHATLEKLPCQKRDRFMSPKDADLEIRLEHATRAMVRLCREFDAVPVLQSYSLPSEINDIVRAYALKENVHFIDHTGPFAQFTSIERYTEVWIHDAHPNKKGYGIMAKSAFDYLTGNSLLPCKQVPQ